MSRDAGSDLGGAIVAALLVIGGGLAIWDTTRYSDADSMIFPRAVAIAMIVFSLGFLLQWLVGRAPAAEAQAGGSWTRRILLVVSMLVASLAMPWIGFVATALVCFGAVLLIAMHDPWTPQRALVYPLVGVAVVVGFYSLFAYGLHVPLPQGRLWQG